MQCDQHPSENPTIGVCASCVRDRLTDLIQLQHNRSRVPFSAPLPPLSSHDTDPDPNRIWRSQSVLKQNNGKKITNPNESINERSGRGKFSLLSRFKQGQGHGHSKPRSHADKMHFCAEIGGSNLFSPHAAAGEKKENGEEIHKPRATLAWISALLHRNHRKKSSSAAASVVAASAAAVQSSKNLSFLSARSSLEEKSGNEGDFAGRDEAFHENIMISGPVTCEDYYSDSDLRKQKANGRILSRLKRRDKNCIAASSSSATARVNMFSESEDEESRKSSPRLNPGRQGNCNGYFSGAFPSPSGRPKGRAGVGRGVSKNGHPDCAGSFSPYTDRKMQSSKAFSMAGRENSGFAFCLSPRRLFNYESSRSPRHGGKLSNFFFSPSRRPT